MELISLSVALTTYYQHSKETLEMQFPRLSVGYRTRKSVCVGNAWEK